jgi:hypothetical protein
MVLFTLIVKRQPGGGYRKLIDGPLQSLGNLKAYRVSFVNTSPEISPWLCVIEPFLLQALRSDSRATTAQN